MRFRICHSGIVDSCGRGNINSCAVGKPPILIAPLRAILFFAERRAGALWYNETECMTFNLF